MFKEQKFTPRQIAHKHWNCADCGRNVIRLGEYYMVKPEVWKRAGMNGWAGNLCIECLEARIGRRLKGFRDFKHMPMNPGGFASSDRYNNRLFGEKICRIMKCEPGDQLPNGWRWRKKRGRYYATDGHTWIGFGANTQVAPNLYEKE